jgi:uncharacterized protein (TIGR03083 family)
MTMTTTAQLAPRPTALDHATAMGLAETEYQRVIDQLAGLSPGQWLAQTECPGWDVRAMAGHLLGMARMAASVRENFRQTRKAQRHGGLFIDALTGLQVEEQASLSTQDLIAAFRAYAPKAVRGRKRTPAFVRRRTMPVTQHVNGIDEPWTLGYLLDTVLTRDPWMHRTDIARACGADLVLTADHDGVIVADVVREWADRHGQPVTLRLTGPAGGSWTFGSGGPSLEYDAVEFCRLLSGRGHGTAAPLDTEVPF